MQTLSFICVPGFVADTKNGVDKTVSNSPVNVIKAKFFSTFGFVSCVSILKEVSLSSLVNLMSG
jgi:hypothetical protein